MAFKDKLKAQATQLAQKAQEAGKAGQAKLEDVQAKRRSDALLRDLGAAVFAEKSGRGTAETTADIQRLVDELTAIEKEDDEAKSAAPEATPEAETPEGGFTL